MRKTYIRAIFFLLLPLLLFNTCRFPQKNEPFCITYHVSVRDTYPHKLLISYTASDTLVTFYCTEKKWTKKVCLSPNDIASLFVKDIFDPKNGYFYMNTENAVQEKQWIDQPIVARIVHKNKEVLSAGAEYLQVSLLLSETEPD